MYAKLMYYAMLICWAAAAERVYINVNAAALASNVIPEGIIIIFRQGVDYSDGDTLALAYLTCARPRLTPAQSQVTPSCASVNWPTIPVIILGQGDD